MASRAVRLGNQDPADRCIAASAMVFGLTAHGKTTVVVLAVSFAYVI